MKNCGISVARFSVTSPFRIQLKPARFGALVTVASYDHSTWQAQLNREKIYSGFSLRGFQSIMAGKEGEVHILDVDRK